MRLVQKPETHDGAKCGQTPPGAVSRLSGHLRHHLGPAWMMMNQY